MYRTAIEKNEAVEGRQVPQAIDYRRSQTGRENMADERIRKRVLPKNGLYQF